jgi:prepilin-type N-terminal cleavage/methylation domain-containing protein
MLTSNCRGRIQQCPQSGQAGFSLIEVTVAMLILLIALLGVFVVFTYAITYNSGNNSRADALALMQQEVESLRSAKFTPTVTDADLIAGNHTPEFVTIANGNTYIVQVVVDDDPFTTGVQVDTTQTIKEVYVTVSLARPTPGWQTSVPATVIFRRVMAN